MKTDERKKIKADAKSKASEVLAQKDEVQMQAKLTELFDEVLTELAEAKSETDKVTQDNSTLSTDLESLKGERDELAKEKAELETKAADLEKKLAEADKKIEALEDGLQSMKQEAALSARVKELEEAGLLSKINDKRKARIKAMSDEEFAEYKSELEELKADWSKGSEGDKPKEKKTTEKKPKTKEVEADVDEDEDEDALAKAALAELAELDLDEGQRITASQLLKLKKAAAAFNVMTLSATAGLDDEEDIGVDSETIKLYEELWADEAGQA